MVNFIRFVDVPGSDCFIGRAKDTGGHEHLYLITERRIYKHNVSKHAWSDISEGEQHLVRRSVTSALQSGVRRYGIHCS